MRIIVWVAEAYPVIIKLSLYIFASSAVCSLPTKMMLRNAKFLGENHVKSSITFSAMSS